MTPALPPMGPPAVHTPRSVPLLAFRALRLADVRYAATWQFRRYGIMLDAIEAAAKKPRDEAVRALDEIISSLEVK